MNIYHIIEKKRDNKLLSKEEIKYFIDEYTKGSIKDYQASALLMAMYINGLNRQETIDLTESIMLSGETIDLSHIDGIKVDKHSTGGVGDKTTLVLTPLLASFGLKVAKMSGRGLGHTGGTVDKLESIKGFKTELSAEDFYDQVNRIGISVIGQTKNIAPADKKLYALRDVTATIDNIGLIASSIMSKKLASGSDVILLDVKVGSGAFLETEEEAEKLAKVMVDIGTGMGRTVSALITDMNEPLGIAVGNSIEVMEAIDTLKGEGPEDFRELCVELATRMLQITDYEKDYDKAKLLVVEKLNNGEALEKFKDFIAAQGGENLELSLAKKKLDIIVEKEGYLHSVVTKNIGEAALILGAGRRTKEEEIDHESGLYFYKKIGDYIKKGDVIATLYTNKKDALEEAKSLIEKSIKIEKEKIDRLKKVKTII